jgi:hypothetical protein
MKNKLTESTETVVYPGGVVSIRYATPEERMEKVSEIRRFVLDK